MRILKHEPWNKIDATTGIKKKPFISRRSNDATNNCGNSFAKSMGKCHKVLILINLIKF